MNRQPPQWALSPTPFYPSHKSNGYALLLAEGSQITEAVLLDLETYNDQFRGLLDKTLQCHPPQGNET